MYDVFGDKYFLANSLAFIQLSILYYAPIWNASFDTYCTFEVKIGQLFYSQAVFKAP